MRSISLLVEDLNLVEKLDNETAESISGGEAAQLSDPSVGGKYEDLIQTVHCPRDESRYGEFNDWGYWGGSSWCDQSTKPGYWVWVNPKWYIWLTKVPAWAR